MHVVYIYHHHHHHHYNCNCNCNSLASSPWPFYIFFISALIIYIPPLLYTPLAQLIGTTEMPNPPPGADSALPLFFSPFHFFVFTSSSSSSSSFLPYPSVYLFYSPVYSKVFSSRLQFCVLTSFAVSNTPPWLPPLRSSRSPTSYVAPFNPVQCTIASH